MNASRGSFLSKPFAFGLLEVLISVVVLAMLAAMCGPAVRSMIDRANGAKCLANMCQLHTGLISYAGDHLNRVPPASDWSKEVYTSNCAWLSYLTWEGYLPVVTGVSNFWTTEPQRQVHFCPGSPVNRKVGGNDCMRGNYGLNRHVAGIRTPNEWFAVPLNRIEQPSRTILLADSGDHTLDERNQRSPKGPRAYLPGLAENANVRWNPDFHEDAVEGRHGRRIHLVMVAGNAEVWNPNQFIGSEMWLP